MNNKIVLQITLMLIVVLLFALIEEYFWDLLVNNEKGEFFNLWLDFTLETNYSGFVRVFFIGLLSIPQITHYILDGYIWKGKTMKYKIF